MPRSSARRKTAPSIAPGEVAQFSRHADDWWNPDGAFRPLHRLNSVRLGYIRDQACAHFKRDTDARHALKGLAVLDAGCGGGLLAEPLARMGAQITGLDASKESIAAAKKHAKESGLKIDYVCGSVEELARKIKSSPPEGEDAKTWACASEPLVFAGGGVSRKRSTPSPAKTKALLRNAKFSLPLPPGERNKFDLITALEIAEHVADLDSFVDALAKLLKPGGLLIMSTLNRTPKSFLLGIVAAEYILNWVPRGTHQWKKFLRPSELVRRLDESGLRTTDLTGLVFNPLRGEFELSTTDLDVNYLLTATKSHPLG